MKKQKLISFLAILFGAYFFIMPTQIAQAVIYSTLDQTCSLASNGDSKVSLTSGGGSQFFTPTQNRLTKVVVKINGDGEGSLTSTIILDTDYVGFSDTVAEPDGLDKIVTLRFDSLALTPGTQYRLAILATYGNDFAEWQYKDACYEGGDALVGGRFQDYDFIFATYGYTEETPPVDLTEDSGSDGGSTVEPETTPESTESSTTTSTSTDSGSSNSSNSSESIVSEQQTSQIPPDNIKINKQGQVQETSTIEPPNDLIGEYKVSKVNLSWQASKTTDIDGYRIFRSEKESGDFQKIEQISKDQLNYSDTSIKKSKQYFYYIKAYRGEEESSPTNTVKVNSFTSDNLSNYSSGNVFSQNQIIFLYFCGLIVLFLFGYLVYRTIKYYKERKIN